MFSGSDWKLGRGNSLPRCTLAVIRTVLAQPRRLAAIGASAIDNAKRPAASMPPVRLRWSADNSANRDCPVQTHPSMVCRIHPLCGIHSASVGGRIRQAF